MAVLGVHLIGHTRVVFRNVWMSVPAYLADAQVEDVVRGLVFQQDLKWKHVVTLASALPEQLQGTQPLNIRLLRWM